MRDETAIIFGLFAVLFIGFLLGSFVFRPGKDTIKVTGNEKQGYYGVYNEQLYELKLVEER